MKKALKGLLVTGITAGVAVVTGFVAHSTGIVDLQPIVEALMMSQDQITAMVAVGGSSTVGLVAVKVASSIIGSKFIKQDQYIAKLENKVDQLEAKVDPKLDKILAYQDIQADLNINSRVTTEDDVERLKAWKADGSKSAIGEFIGDLVVDNKEELKDLAEDGLDLIKAKLKESL